MTKYKPIGNSQKPIEDTGREESPLGADSNGILLKSAIRCFSTPSVVKKGWSGGPLTSHYLLLTTIHL